MTGAHGTNIDWRILGPACHEKPKEQGRRATTRPLLSPKEGWKTVPLAFAPGCAGWLSRGGCGFVLVVQVGVDFWASPFFFLVSRGSALGGGACTTSSHHFPVVSPGGASSVAPSPPHTLPAQNICHRLVASTNLALSDKSHLFHSRGAHFPPRLKMRKAVGVILSR